MSMLKRMTLATALFVSTASANPASLQLDARVRAMVEDKLAYQELQSVVIGLTDGSAETVIGFAPSGQPVPDERAVYEIGSVTKTFTALLLAQEARGGKVTLDTPLSAVFPAHAMPALDGKPITLLDLATQSSGLPRLPANLKPADMANPYREYGSKEMMDYLASAKLASSPGTRYEYSNLGFGLLGQALSTLEKRTYAQLLQENIVTPLGMDSTATTLTKEMKARLTPGHDAQGNPVANWDFDAMAGAGAIKSDARDMLRYLRAVMHEHRGDGSPYALVQTPLRATSLPDTRIGLAWNVSAMRGKTLVWHNGMTGGYASFIGFTDDGKQGVVVLANTARQVDAIALASLFPETAVSAKRVNLSIGTLAKYVGRYELAPGFILTVTPTEKGLSVQASGQPPFAAYALAEDEFQIPDVDARLSFTHGAQGDVVSVTLHQHGRDILGKKIGAN